jgi:hypothetical protein
MAALFVILAPAKKVRTNRLDGFFGAGKRNDEDVIHARKGGERAGPESILEERPPRAFADKFVGRDGDDEDIAEGARLLEMRDETGMKQFKDAVALDDFEALLAQPREKAGRGVERNEFGGIGIQARQRERNW